MTYARRDETNIIAIIASFSYVFQFSLHSSKNNKKNDNQNLSNFFFDSSSLPFFFFFRTQKLQKHKLEIFLKTKDRNCNRQVSEDDDDDRGKVIGTEGIVRVLVMLSVLRSMLGGENRGSKGPVQCLGEYLTRSGDNRIKLRGIDAVYPNIESFSFCSLDIFTLSGFGDAKLLL